MRNSLAVQQLSINQRNIIRFPSNAPLRRPFFSWKFINKSIKREAPEKLLIPRVAASPELLSLGVKQHKNIYLN
jgi:hypothetical protein